MSKETPPVSAYFASCNDAQGGSINDRETGVYKGRGGKTLTNIDLGTTGSSRSIYH